MIDTSLFFPYLFAPSHISMSVTFRTTWKEGDENRQSCPFWTFTSFTSPSLSSQTNSWNLHFPWELTMVLSSVFVPCVCSSGMIICPFSFFLHIVFFGSFSFYFFQRLVLFIVYLIILPLETQIMDMFLNSTVFFPLRYSLLLLLLFALLILNVLLIHICYCITS